MESRWALAIWLRRIRLVVRRYRAGENRKSRHLFRGSAALQYGGANAAAKPVARSAKRTAQTRMFALGYRRCDTSEQVTRVQCQGGRSSKKSRPSPADRMAKLESRVPDLRRTLLALARATHRSAHSSIDGHACASAEFLGRPPVRLTRNRGSAGVQQCQCSANWQVRRRLCRLVDDPTRRCDRDQRRGWPPGCAVGDQLRRSAWLPADAPASPPRAAGPLGAR